METISRLRLLQDALEAAHAVRKTPSDGPATAVLARIERLTALLKQRSGRPDEGDTVDSIAAGLLLADYSAVVAQLRAEAEATGVRLRQVARVLDDGQRAVRDHAKENAARRLR